MKKVIFTLSSSLLLAFGFIAFQAGILLPPQQFFEVKNPISVAHAKSDQAFLPQQAFTPLAEVNEQQIVSLVQTQAVQSNMQLSQAELQTIVQKVMDELQRGVYQHQLSIIRRNLFLPAHRALLRFAKLKTRLR
jgi:hypothetical protein